MTNRSVNGWRDGRDPVQRWLRIASAVACMIGMAYVLVQPDRSLDDLPVFAFLGGMLLVLLGYEGLVKLPLIGKDKEAPHGD